VGGGIEVGSVTVPVAAAHATALEAVSEDELRLRCVSPDAIGVTVDLDAT